MLKTGSFGTGFAPKMLRLTEDTGMVNTKYGENWEKGVGWVTIV